MMGSPLNPLKGLPLNPLKGTFGIPANTDSPLKGSPLNPLKGSPLNPLKGTFGVPADDGFTPKSPKRDLFINKLFEPPLGGRG